MCPATAPRSEAARWFRLAADQGDANAQFALGGMYQGGRGVQQDNLMAYQWFSQAAANPDLSDEDDPVSELYSLADKLPAGTKSLIVRSHQSRSGLGLVIGQFGPLVHSLHGS